MKTACGFGERCLVDDVSLGGDLVDVIRRYRHCLEQDDQDLPEDFPLWEVVEKHGSRQGSPFPPISHEKKDQPPPAATKKPAKKR
jgi:hypothetical protein